MREPGVVLQVRVAPNGIAGGAGRVPTARDRSSRRTDADGRSEYASCQRVLRIGCRVWAAAHKPVSWPSFRPASTA